MEKKKKKRPARLALAKKRLRTLNPDEAGAVQGGNEIYYSGVKCIRPTTGPEDTV